MTWRIGLIALQAVGALSVLAYPAVLTASLMALGGEGPRGLQRLAVSIPYVLLALYPAVWIGLYLWAWRLLNRGVIGPAFAISLLPVLASLAVVRFVLASDPPSKEQERSARTWKAEVEQVNPLVWSILCAGYPYSRPAGAAALPIEEALRAVQESDRVNVPVAGLGSPLKVALHHLKYNFDETPYDGRQEGFQRLVRALVARGAVLTPEEAQDWDNLWRLKRATFVGAITTRKENPLVWRLLEVGDPKGPYVREGREFELQAADIVLLNIPTRLHGTPLYLALRMRWKRVAKTLIKAGARLSAEEMGEPGAAEALREVLEEHA